MVCCGLGGSLLEEGSVMPPVPWVSVIAAAAPYVHLVEPAAQVPDPRLSPVPSLSVSLQLQLLLLSLFLSNLWLK